MMIRPGAYRVVIALLGVSACGVLPEDPAPGSVPSADLTPEVRMAVDAGLDHLAAHAAAFGLGGRGDLRLLRAFADELDLTHARFQQTTGGVPVFGGEGIVHLRRDRSIAGVTDGFVPRIAVDPTPKLSVDEAIGRALPPGSCASCQATPPTADLWALRHDGRDRLVWRVQLRLDEGTNRISLPVVFVDAHDGSIVWQYENLQTATGPSLYSGTLTFDTTLNASTHYMEDLSRKIGTFDLQNGYGTTLYRVGDLDDVWNAAGQRAAIDAQYGAVKTCEYFKATFDRDGIDGLGGPGSQVAVDGVTPLITSRVHYGTQYNNAFWDGTQMTYGDGDGVQFSSLVSLDVAGHEMMHGITQSTAGLIYAGESGALNESYSDIFGAMVERYARGESDAIWKIGDEIYTPGTAGDALRFMAEPHQASNKGYTADDDPDHYSERYTDLADNGGVHINSGIANKTFYLLAMGGTHHLGGSMTGIGADKAAAIWYKALTAYLTSSATFVQAARATYDAAVALYGAGSDEATAVVTAWGVTGVVIDLSPPVVAITAPLDGATVAVQVAVTASATDNVSVAWVKFLVDGTVVGQADFPPYTYSWNTAVADNGTHTLAARAFDWSGHSAESAPITVTVANETVPPSVAITAPLPGATVSDLFRSVVVDATDNTGISKVELYVDGILYQTNDRAPYQFGWITNGLDNGPHVLTAKAWDVVGNSTTSAPVQVFTSNDRTPPTIAITSPADGAVIADTVMLVASASDNVRVTFVEFYVGGTPVAYSTTGPWASWNTHTFPDGTYALQARASDANNNISTSATVMVTVDNHTPPTTAAITSPAPGSTVAGTTAITANTSNNAAVTRVELLVDGVVVGTDKAPLWGVPLSWGFSWNTLTSGNGPHELAARAFDALNNAVTSSAVSVTVQNPGLAAYDATLHAPRCTAAGPLCDTGVLVNGRGDRGPEPNASNTIGGTCIDGSYGTYHVSESLDRLRIFTSGGTPITSGQPITIEATVWTPNGILRDYLDLFYTSTPANPVWTLIGTLWPSNAGASKLSTTFTLPPGAQHAIRGQYRSDGTSSPCDSGPLDDRDDLVFAAVDVPDTTPPAAAITAPATGAALAGAAIVNATATDSAGVTAVELYVDGVRIATSTRAPSSFSWDTTTVPDGTHTLAIRALDRAGNAGTSAVSIRVINNDVTPPSASITSPLPGSTVSGVRNVDIAATDDLGVTTVEVYLDGVLIGTAATAPYRVTWNTAAVPNGAHTLQARARDAAGHVGASAPVAITVGNVDTTPPAVSIASPASGATVGAVATVSVAATDFNGVTAVELYMDGALIGTTSTSPYSFSWDTTAVPNGAHTLQARARDAAANVGASAPVALTVANVDTTPPATSITSPAAGAILAGTVTVTASATDLNGVAAVDLYMDGALIGTDSTSPYSFSWDTTAIPNGAHTLQARARDAAANVGASAPVSLTVANADTTPPATAITSPAAGAVLAGTVTVTASASDFNGVAAVDLLLDGGVIATATSAPWSFTWDTTTVANRARTLQTRARDAAGNAGASAPVAVTVDNGIGTAAYDPVLRAPRCAVGYDGCDTGTLVNGRAGLGPEPNTSNTINDSCPDGTAGTYHASSSIDRLRVFTTDGTPLAAGKSVTIEATVWSYYTSNEYDVLDLYYTSSPSSPSWTYIGSVTPGSPQGIRVVTASFTLPSGPQTAIRANLRRRQGANKTPSPCTAGQYNDHDDLVFAVGGP